MMVKLDQIQDLSLQIVAMLVSSQQMERRQVSLDLYHQMGSQANNHLGFEHHMD
jgi:hypothetical protein